MSTYTCIRLTAQDFDHLTIGPAPHAHGEGEVAATQSGWLLTGEPRYLRILAAALAEAAGKAEAAAQLTPPAVAS